MTKTMPRLVDIVPGLVYTEHGFGMLKPPETTTVAISIVPTQSYALTLSVTPRHTRVYELPNDDPMLVEYRALSDRWHTLQGKLAERYHHV